MAEERPFRPARTFELKLRCGLIALACECDLTPDGCQPPWHLIGFVKGDENHPAAREMWQKDGKWREDGKKSPYDAIEINELTPA